MPMDTTEIPITVQTCHSEQTCLYMYHKYDSHILDGIMKLVLTIMLRFISCQHASCRNAFTMTFSGIIFKFSNTVRFARRLMSRVCNRVMPY